MIVDGLPVSKGQLFSVAEFARDRLMMEVNKAGRSIYGVFETWAWHSQLEGAVKERI